MIDICGFISNCTGVVTTSFAIIHYQHTFTIDNMHVMITLPPWDHIIYYQKKLYEYKFTIENKQKTNKKRHSLGL